MAFCFHSSILIGVVSFTFFIIAHSLTLMYKHSTQHFLVTNQVAVKYWYFQHAHSHEDDSASVVFLKESTSFDFGYSCVHNSSEIFVFTT